MLRSYCKLSLLGLLVLIVSACGGPERTTRHGGVGDLGSDRRSVGGYKIGKPYQVNGQWYYPAVDYDYDETGIASWYGPGFHGKRTASGEHYDQNAMTAAHRTLPMPTIVRVTNLDNGRSVKVRINDRGPFARGRIIDLSRRAAQLLDVERTGTAKVRVTVIEDESRRLVAQAMGQGGPVPAAAPTEKVTTVALTPSGSTGSQALPDPNPPSSVLVAAPTPAASITTAPLTPPGEVEQRPVGRSDIYVQAGAFSVYENAKTLGAELDRLGPVSLSSAKVQGQQFYRVRLGPVGTVEEADRLLARLAATGYPQAKIVID